MQLWLFRPAFDWSLYEPADLSRIFFLPKQLPKFGNQLNRKRKPLSVASSLPSYRATSLSHLENLPGSWRSFKCNCLPKCVTFISKVAIIHWETIVSSTWSLVDVRAMVRLVWRSVRYIWLQLIVVAAFRIKTISG